MTVLFRTSFFQYNR